MNRKNVDMITLQVIMNALYSITDEMNLALIRTAYSTNIKDRRDCSCAIYTKNLEVISQTELGCPIHRVIMPSALDYVFQQMSLDDLDEGDHIIFNVPYPVGPGHLNDILLLTPVFVNGTIEFIAANMAHHSDLGGYAPGSMASGLREIYQEGLQIPPLKIVKKGIVDEELLSFIVQNVRTSTEVRGDLHAQMACNNVGAKRLKEMCGQYGVASLQNYIEAQFDYSEKRMREGLKALPHGIYTYEDYIEGTERTPPLVKIKVKTIIDNNGILFDFEGTDPQVDDSFNSNIACTRSACYYVVKVLVDPGLPPNIGTYRPITVKAPYGSVINCKAPAAIANSTIITAPKVVDVLMGALYKAAPERSAAASNGVTSLFNIGGTDSRGNLYNYIETYAGGQGAMKTLDGMDAVQTHMTNTRNAPAEVIEMTYPLMVRSNSLEPDTDGAGRFRGGLGMRRCIQVLSTKTTLTLSTDRMAKHPWGVYGGMGGGTSHCILQTPDKVVRELAYSKMTLPVDTDTIVTIITPGAGGWGDPFTRDPQKVLKDVREELISIERARDCYGVVIRKKDRHYSIDEALTDKIRAEHVYEKES